MGDDKRLDRLRRNEEMFREVNERMADVAEPFDEIAGGSAIGFVCECSRTECVEQIELDLEQYRSIRADPDQFVVRPGHEQPEIEDVIQRGTVYVVVRKRI